MTKRELDGTADAISLRYQSFDPGGSVRFGIEEAVLTVSEVLSALDPAFDATDFRHRCFGREVT